MAGGPTIDHLRVGNIGDRRANPATADAEEL
jgi:hypothetical protein